MLQDGREGQAARQMREISLKTAELEALQLRVGREYNAVQRALGKLKKRCSTSSFIPPNMELG